MIIAFGVFAAQGALRAVSLLDSPAAAIAIGILAPLVAALAVYRTMLPSRTAIGSALALRTESFRRFLAASEARHVEWAWSKGLLREYSAWAVALGTAETWEAAMNASTVPPAELHAVAPLLLYHYNGRAHQHAGGAVVVRWIRQLDRRRVLRRQRRRRRGRRQLRLVVTSSPPIWASQSRYRECGRPDRG